MPEAATKAAVAFAAGQAGDPLVSASVAALAREMLRSMLLRKMNLVAMTLAFLGTAGAAYAMHTPAMKPEPRDPPAETQQSGTALLAQPAKPLALSGVVVDRAGKPVADVDVVLAAWNPADGSVPTLARTTTDDQGTFHLQVAEQQLKEMGPNPFVWAYRPGRSLAVQEAVLTGKGALPTFRLTLAEPWKRTLTILDSEGRPVTGARLAQQSSTASQVSAPQMIGWSD